MSNFPYWKSTKPDITKNAKIDPYLKHVLDTWGFSPKSETSCTPTPSAYDKKVKSVVCEGSEKLQDDKGKEGGMPLKVHYGNDTPNKPSSWDPPNFAEKALPGEIRKLMNLLNVASRRDRIKVVERLQEIAEAIISKAAYGSVSDNLPLVQEAVLRALSDDCEACRRGASETVIRLTALQPQGDRFYEECFNALAQKLIWENFDCEAPRSIEDFDKVELNEPCEEIRLHLVNWFTKSLNVASEAAVINHLAEIKGILSAALLDALPQVRVLAWGALCSFCKTHSYLVSKLSTSFARISRSSLSHRHSKVRLAALHGLTAIMRCSVHSMNAEVIKIMIGWQDPNLLPVKAFFENETTVNCFAKLIQDGSATVRYLFLTNLALWNLTLPDKSDYEAWLLPYLITGLFDELPVIQRIVYCYFGKIGALYERDHEKELRGYDQYHWKAEWEYEGAADGSLAVKQFWKFCSSTIHKSPTSAEPQYTTECLTSLHSATSIYLDEAPELFKDFEETLQFDVQRPSLGARCFVQQHFRRFAASLFKDVLDFNEVTAVRSGLLLMASLIFLEDEITEWMHSLIEICVKQVSKEDKVTRSVYETVATMAGIYNDPSIYWKLILPYIREDLRLSSGDTCAVLIVLDKLLAGSFSTLKSTHNMKTLGLGRLRTAILDIIHNFYEIVSTQNIPDSAVAVQILKIFETIIFESNAAIVQVGVPEICKVVCASLILEKYGKRKHTKNGSKEPIEVESLLSYRLLLRLSAHFADLVPTGKHPQDLGCHISNTEKHLISNFFSNAVFPYIASNMQMAHLAVISIFVQVIPHKTLDGRIIDWLKSQLSHHASVGNIRSQIEFLSTCCMLLKSYFHTPERVSHACTPGIDGAATESERTCTDEEILITLLLSNLNVSAKDHENFGASYDSVFHKLELCEEILKFPAGAGAINKLQGRPARSCGYFLFNAGTIQAISQLVKFPFLENHIFRRTLLHYHQNYATRVTSDALLQTRDALCSVPISVSKQCRQASVQKSHDLQLKGCSIMFASILRSLIEICHFQNAAVLTSAWANLKAIAMETSESLIMGLECPEKSMKRRKLLLGSKNRAATDEASQESSPHEDSNEVIIPLKRLPPACVLLLIRSLSFLFCFPLDSQDLVTSTDCDKVRGILKNIKNTLNQSIKTKNERNISSKAIRTQICLQSSMPAYTPERKRMDAVLSTDQRKRMADYCVQYLITLKNDPECNSELPDKRLVAETNESSIQEPDDAAGDDLAMLREECILLLSRWLGAIASDLEHSQNNGHLRLALIEELHSFLCQLLKPAPSALKELKSLWQCKGRMERVAVAESVLKSS